MPKHHAVLQKKMQKLRAWPDLFLPEPRGTFSGLFIELKSAISSEVLRDGTVGNGEHVREQREVLAMLEQRGFRADFAVGFEGAQNLINDYLSTPPKK